MNRGTIVAVACVAAYLWMQRATYVAEAEERVLYAARLGRGGPVVTAEATGDGKRELYVAMVRCGLFPDAEARVLLSRRGFTRVTCDDSEGVHPTELADLPLLARALDP